VDVILSEGVTAWHMKCAEEEITKHKQVRSASHVPSCFCRAVVDKSFHLRHCQS
jgi:hypothetical protein